MSKPKQVHFMLDLETLDTAPTAHVLSAALVLFDPITGDVLPPPQDEPGYAFLFNSVSETYKTKKSIVFRLEDQNGSTVSFRTLNWWNQQNKAYFDTLIADDKKNWSLMDFLVDFSRTINRLINIDECEVHVWCTGTFDVDILKNATERAGLEWNLPYWATKDVRVARQLVETFDLLDEELEVTHDAYDDCIRQIKYVSAVYGKLNNARSV